MSQTGTDADVFIVFAMCFQCIFCVVMVKASVYLPTKLAEALDISRVSLHAD